MHVYKNYCTVHQPVGHLALESLRLAAVQHVDVLAGDEGWEEADIHEVLGALPGPVNSVRVWAGPFRATLGLGQDDKDQVGGSGSRGPKHADVSATAFALCGLQSAGQ